MHMELVLGWILLQAFTFNGLLINYLGLRGHVSGVCEQLWWSLGQVLIFSRVYIEQQLSFE